MNPLLTIDGLSVDFISAKMVVNAVTDISFSVRRGQVVAIVGESGSGKTVSALSILQLLPAKQTRYRAGKILFSGDGLTGEDLLEKDQKELRAVRGNRISMIFQEPMSSLNPVFNCGSQLTEAIINHKHVSKASARDLAIEWFSKVKLPEPAKIFSRYPHELSGGQKQRVMIAMAMCCDPDLLICDEPTTALDVTVQKTILELIDDLKKEKNIGVIFISHDLGVVAEIADEIVVMFQGEIVEKNSVENILHHPRHPYTKALLACRPSNHQRGQRLPVVSDFLGKKENSQQAPVEPHSKKQQAKREKIPGIEKALPLLSVNNLSVWFPIKKDLFGKAISYVKAVDGVSFDVSAGETLGLVGESGCGKTTLGRSLLRLIQPTKGEIIYKGDDLATRSNHELRALRKDIQIIFQDPYSSLNPRISIGAALTEPLKVHRLYAGEKQRKEKVLELLHKVDLKPEHFDRYPHEFSGGQRQRIVIARALALNPGFIVCDEPVSALDVSVQAQVLNLLNELKKEFGFTTIFISHDLSVVRYFCDRIMVMNKGKIEEVGEADDIYYNPQMEYTKKLVASIPSAG